MELVFKPSQIISRIKSRVKTGNTRSIYIKGKPGGGKTEITKQAAREIAATEKNFGFKMIHAPLMQPEDYGLPVPSKDRESVNFIVSQSKFPIEGSDCPERGIFLIDELPQADAAGQKILANLIQEREIHGHKIKEGWFIVATGNNAGDRSGAGKLLTHLADRVSIFELVVSLDDWTQWALQSNIPMEVVSFIRFRPDLLNLFDPHAEKNATPRGWAQGVAAALAELDPETELQEVAGDVGKGPAVEFIAFLRVFRNLPNIDAILHAPKTTAVPTDTATLYAVCGALAHKATRGNLANALTYVQRIRGPKGEERNEFQALFMRDCITRNSELAETKTYLQWAVSEGKDLLT